MTLINSLARSGYEGAIWCGVRGERPDWMSQPDQLPGIRLCFASVDPSEHLMNYKAAFILDVAERVPTANAFVYLDPDIVVKCAWADIADWCRHGIAAIGDGNWLMPASSPVRARWRAFRAESGVALVPGEAVGSLDIYCNSGFVGIPRQDLGFVELWRDLLLAAISRDVYNDERVTQHFKTLGHLDQELFNLALMSFAHRCSLRGPEAMDFAPGGEILSHAIGAPKPWQKHYVRRALVGRAPSKVDKEFLRYCRSPLPAVSATEQRTRMASYSVARAIGAVFRRSDY
jgi:hypothetical protein